jgi:hypothetical protein
MKIRRRTMPMAKKQREPKPTGQPKEPWEFRQERVNKLMSDLEAVLDCYVVVIGASDKFDRDRHGKCAGPFVAWRGDKAGAEGAAMHLGTFVGSIGLPTEDGNLPNVELETDDDDEPEGPEAG